MTESPSRTLRFPADRPVGTVTVKAADGTTSSCPAQGEVAVPAGGEAHLYVGAPYDGTELPGFVPGDVSPLADLEPAALQSLHVEDLDSGATASIAHLTDVRTLHLAGRVTDADLSALAGMAAVDTLQLFSESVVGPGLAHVGAIGGLKRLDLACPNVAASALGLLGDLHSLTLLILHWELDADQARALPSLPNLRLLVLGSAGGGDALLDVPARLPSLADLRCVVDAEHEAELRRRYPKLTVNGSWLAPEAVARLGDDVAPIETNPSPPADVRPVELTAGTWEEAIAGDTPVLVDFWAAWCGPCRAMAPTIETLAPELAGRVTVAKLDVENEQGIAERYGIMGIPALLLFRRGEQIAKLARQDREGILEELGRALARPPSVSDRRM